MAERKRSRAAEFASSSGGGGEGRFDLAGLFGVGPSINKDFVAGKEGAMPYKTSTIGKVLNPYSARGAEAGNLDYLITQRENAAAEQAAEMAAARELDRQIAGEGAKMEMTTRAKLDDENRMRANKQATYSKLKPTLTAILQKNGMMDIVLPDSAEEAEMLLGDVMKTQGLGGGYSGMTSQVGKDALTNIENFGRRSIAQTPQGMNDIMSGYGAAARQPQFHQTAATAELMLAQQNQAANQQARLASQQAAQDDLALRRDALNFNQNQPIVQNGFVFTPKAGMQYNMYATTPAQDAQNTIITNPETGRQEVVNVPAKAATLTPIPMGGGAQRTPEFTLPPDDIATPAPQPAPTVAPPLSAAPQQRTITPDEYFRRLNATPEYPNMTPTMQEIASSNRTPQDKQSLLMPMAQQQQAQYLRELEARRRQQQGLRPTLGQVLGF